MTFDESDGEVLATLVKHGGTTLSSGGCVATTVGVKHKSAAPSRRGKAPPDGIDRKPRPTVARASATPSHAYVGRDLFCRPCDSDSEGQHIKGSSARAVVTAMPVLHAAGPQAPSSSCLLPCTSAKLCRDCTWERSGKKWPSIHTDPSPQGWGDCLGRLAATCVV